MRVLQCPVREHVKTGSATDTICIPRLTLTSYGRAKLLGSVAEPTGDPSAAMLPRIAS